MIEAFGVGKGVSLKDQFINDLHVAMKKNDTKLKFDFEK